MEKTKTIGKRQSAKKGLKAAADFLKLAIRLRGDKSFIPKGIHRFKSYEEAQSWSLKMLTRPKKAVLK